VATDALADLLGDSAPMVAFRHRVAQLIRAWSGARRPPPVLMQGETGTGKGLLASTLHRASPRAHARLVDVNCAAIPEALLESELFGHERGAFTDARQSKPGLFQVADGGTVFLDEVGLLPQALQAKLLSVLETRAVRRVGGTTAEPIDVWFVAATNENLAAAVRDRRFREDLYHRLAVVVLDLPPLRERGDDILLLAEHFLRRACTDYGVPPKSLSADARAALRAYAWPGNIRELSNVIERIALLVDARVVTAHDLGLPADAAHESTAGTRRDDGVTRGATADPRRDELLAALTRTGWNISRTAALLGLARNTVNARIDRFGLRADPGARPARRPAAPTLPPRAPSTVAASATRTSRRLTLLAVTLEPPADGESRAGRLLELVREKVRTFGGRVERASAGGLLAAFGIDELDEPAARAAHCALVIHHAARRARIALHTADVIVDSRAVPAALDAAGSRAAWSAVDALVDAAPPGTTAVAPATAALLRRRFDLVAEQSGGFRLEGLWFARGGNRPLDAKLAGREQELALLESRLESAARGHGHAVEISGEAGIGKSRLLLELVAGPRADPPVYLEGRCAPAATTIPFHPFLMIVRSACGIAESDELEVVRERVVAALTAAGLDAEALAPMLIQLLATTPEPDPGPAAAERRAPFFSAITELLLAQSDRAPLLIAVEDLHWIDPTSQACLASLVDALAGSRILLVMTYRAGYRPPWVGRSDVTRLTLLPLSPEESMAIVRWVRHANTVGDDVERSILARAEGNPLFLEELSRSAGERDDAPPRELVPASIEDVISIRISRLAPGPRDVLATAAVIGRDAPLALLRELTGLTEGDLLEDVAALRAAEFLLPGRPHRGEVTYTFKHALVQEVAYAQVAEPQPIHARIVDALERIHAGRLTEQVEWLAHHAVLGEVWAKAVPYLLEAGWRAMARSAMSEALGRVTRGLELIAELPASLERDRLEMQLWTARGTALVATRGYAAAETGEAYARARALCQRLGDTAHLVSVLCGEWNVHVVRARYGEAFELGRQLLDLARQTADPAALMEGHMAVGIVSLFHGEVGRARDELQRAIELYDGQAARHGSPHSATADTKVACLVFQGRALCILGYPDRAVQRAEHAVALAEELGLPLSIAQAMCVAANIHQVRRDVEQTLAWAERVRAYASDHDIRYWAALASIVRSWAVAQKGEPDRAISEIRRSLERYRATGATLGSSWYLAMLAEMHMARGQAREARVVIEEALAWIRTTGEAYWEAELYRLRGTLACSEGGAEAAEADFRQAIDVARRQQALLWELRATTGLARLLHARGQSHDARDRLAAVHARFTEGFDTADLRDASALLDQLPAREPHAPGTI